MKLNIKRIKMKIVTLTLNPALDKSSYIDHIQPEKKLRCETPVYEPGGGGINISRAIKILGGESLAIIASGGATGAKINELLNGEGIQVQNIDTQNPTRENLLIMERITGQHYRFGMPGYKMNDDELQQCIDIVENLPGNTEYFVASGSLPPGAPPDLYGTLAQIARNNNIKCLIDTSGDALLHAARMGLCIMKPNLRELSQLAGKDQISGTEQEDIARQIIEEGLASMLVVSLGPRGAMLVTREKTEYVVPPTVVRKSTVGAGDSMVAAMILSLSRGHDPSKAVKWGVAAGTAATMTAGTELCRKEDVERIYQWITQNHKNNR
jgi:6-phosphofructokinase 2